MKCNKNDPSGKPEEVLTSLANGTLLRRLPMLQKVADVTAFVASDHASIMTGTVVKLDCGALVG